MATAVLHPQLHCTSEIPFAPAHCPYRSRNSNVPNSHRRRRRHEKNTGRRRKEKTVVKEMGNIVRILKRDEINVIPACSTDQVASKQIAVRREKKAADHHRFAGYVYTPPHPSSLPMPMMNLCRKKDKFDDDDAKQTDCPRQQFNAVNIKIYGYADIKSW